MPRPPSRAMLPLLLASRVAGGASSPCRAHLPAPRAPPPLGLGWQVTHRFTSVSALLQSLSALWFWPLSLLDTSQLAHGYFIFFPRDGFLHPFPKDKTNCLFNLPGNKRARGGVGREADLLFLWADLPGYFQRQAALTHLVSFPL